MRRWYYYTIEIIASLRMWRDWRGRLHGFNGQKIRADYIAWLYRRLGCTSFVETGTWRGATAITARQMLGGPVFTVESAWRIYVMARIVARLLGVSGIRFVHDDSRKALAKWLGGAEIGALPMLYLDAHWYHDHPLSREVELAVQRGTCVVVIDDCRVEADPGFGYDKDPFLIALPSIASILPPDRVIALQPTHPASAESGLRRGATVLLIDLPLPSDAPGTFGPVSLASGRGRD